MVQPVGADIGLRRRHFHLAQALFFQQRRIAPAHVHAFFGQAKVRLDDVEAVKVDFDHGPGIHRIGQRHHAGPGTGEAAHLPAMDAIVQHVLDRGRVQHRDLGIHHREFGLGGQGGGFAIVVVADNGEHAAECGRACGIGMLEHVARAVDARRLAVPDAEQAIIFRAREQAELLAAPDGCGAEVFVQAFPEFDVMRVQPFLRGAQLLVISAKGRPTISGDKSGRVHIIAQIEAFSIKRQADQCLNTGHIRLALDKIVFVVQRNFTMMHG
jgi:hypothetical protein